MNLNFTEVENKCIFLIGVSVNVDVLFSYSQFELTQNINEVENFSLFENKNYKTILHKNHIPFLKNSKRENWNSQLLIKNVKDSKLAQPGDLIIDCDNTNKAKLFKAFCIAQNIEFSQEENAFVQKYAKDLKELVVCNMLKTVQVELSNWEAFLDAPAVSWYGKLKNNTLLEEAVLTDNAIPVMLYMLKSNVSADKKAALQFLLSNIKDGQKIWENNEMWKELL